MIVTSMFMVSTRIDFFLLSNIMFVKCLMFTKVLSHSSLHITAANATLPVGAVPYACLHCTSYPPPSLDSLPPWYRLLILRVINEVGDKNIIKWIQCCQPMQKYPPIQHFTLETWMIFALNPLLVFGKLKFQLSSSAYFTNTYTGSMNDVCYQVLGIPDKL